MVRKIALIICILLQSCILFCMNTLSIAMLKLPPIHCLAFINNATLVVGTGSKCLVIEQLGTQKCLATTFDERAPCNFITSHDRKLLAIKRKEELTLYNLDTKTKLSQTQTTHPLYSAAISTDNISFICYKDKLCNIQSSEYLKLAHRANGFCIACHPQQKIISYVNNDDEIINTNYQGEILFTYQPDLHPINPRAFYAKKDHIASIFYSPDGNALACITQENYIFVYDIKTKKTSLHGTKQHATFFNASIIALMDHHGSISFVDYKKKDVDQNIICTNTIASYPIFSPSSKKRFDFSPNKLLFALCIDGKSHIKHTPIDILKDFFVIRYFFLEQCHEEHGLPCDITNLIMLALIWPHLHHPLPQG